uniref:Uncharacterized protein n=4 Tax=Cercopithecidae TaxID=9527 RepID=A0A2K5L0Z0_CERAT|nr:unnamed protein product [Macaca fascicularis]
MVALPSGNVGARWEPSWMFKLEDSTGRFSLDQYMSLSQRCKSTFALKRMLFLIYRVNVVLLIGIHYESESLD